MFDGKSSENAGNLIGRSKVYMMEEIFVPTQERGNEGSGNKWGRLFQSVKNKYNYLINLPLFCYVQITTTIQVFWTYPLSLYDLSGGNELYRLYQ